MILIVASVVDGAAVRLAEEIRTFTEASVLTCRDLALTKCAIRYPDVGASAITIDGRVVKVRSLRGVLNLLPAVFPEELGFFPAAEQEYQTAEFHALLTFFLAALPCPVVNRPTPVGLTGPCSGQAAWYHVATSVGVPVADVRLNSDWWVKPTEADATVTTVACLQGCVLGAVLGAGEEATADHVRRIAAAAGVEYLRATFVWRERRPALLSVSTLPTLRDRATRSALLGLSRRWAEDR